jgi:hypothetical protein
MSRELTAEDLECWRRLVQAEHTSAQARATLPARRPGLVELVRRGLHEPGERATALDVASHLRADELQELFPDLLALANFGHGFTERCRELIGSLPRPWVLAHIEHAVEPILADGSAEEFRALLDLLARLDAALARRLAGRALGSPDPDVREAGDDFLRALEKSTASEVSSQVSA